MFYRVLLVWQNLQYSKSTILHKCLTFSPPGVCVLQALSNIEPQEIDSDQDMAPVSTCALLPYVLMAYITFLAAGNVCVFVCIVQAFLKCPKHHNSLGTALKIPPISENNFLQSDSRQNSWLRTSSIVAAHKSWNGYEAISKCLNSSGYSAKYYSKILVLHCGKSHTSDTSAGLENSERGETESKDHQSHHLILDMLLFVEMKK